MLKTLAARAIVPITLSITGFVVVCCILLYTSMKHDRISESVLHANDIASVLVKSTRYAMLKADRETLRNIVNNVAQEAIVEHVRIFNKQGIIVFSGKQAEVGQLLDKEAEGCSLCHSGGSPAKPLGPMEQARQYVAEGGEPVLAITAPLYNEPDCSNAQCHYHSSTQTVLGTLDIGLTAEGLQQDLRVMGQRLALFSLMVLVLSVGGVAALLRRNVVGPIRDLATYASRLEAGNEAGEPPATEGELAVIERALCALEQRLEHLKRDSG